MFRKQELLNVHRMPMFDHFMFDNLMFDHFVELQSIEVDSKTKST
jgi:hypothetical protein